MYQLVERVYLSQIESKKSWSIRRSFTISRGTIEMNCPDYHIQWEWHHGLNRRYRLRRRVKPFCRECRRTLRRACHRPWKCDLEVDHTRQQRNWPDYPPSTTTGLIRWCYKMMPLTVGYRTAIRTTPMYRHTARQRWRSPVHRAAWDLSSTRRTNKLQRNMSPWRISSDIRAISTSPSSSAPFRRRGKKAAGSSWTIRIAARMPVTSRRRMRCCRNCITSMGMCDCDEGFLESFCCSSMHTYVYVCVCASMCVCLSLSVCVRVGFVQIAGAFLIGTFSIHIILRMSMHSFLSSWYVEQCVTQVHTHTRMLHGDRLSRSWTNGAASGFVHM